MPVLEQMKGKDWLIVFLVLLQVGELVAAVMRFMFPWTLWAVIAAVGALAAVVAWTVPLMHALKLPAIGTMFIAFGGMLLTLIIRGTF